MAARPLDTDRKERVRVTAGPFRGRQGLVDDVSREGEVTFRCGREIVKVSSGRPGLRLRIGVCNAIQILMKPYFGQIRQ